MTGVRPAPPRRLALRLLLAAVGVAIVAGGGYAVYSEMRRAERDRHAVIKEVGNLERLIRRHDGELFVKLRVARAPDPAHGDREAILRDFERLSHVEGFRIADLDVVVTGDSAVAAYTYEGRPPNTGGRPGEVPAPRSGEIRFVRQGEQWEIIGHGFVAR